MTRRRIAAALAGLLLSAAGCTNPVEPDPPPGAPPVLLCPASQTVTADGAAGAVVSYPAPSVTGGTAPVAAPLCTPPSGSTMGMGTTTVNCSAQDADERAASCSFAVTVAPPPTLTRTKFVAFGDSITEGGLSFCGQLTPGLRGRAMLHDMVRMKMAVSGPASYPSQLQTLLTTRYATQNPTVVNEGRGGETMGPTIYTGEDDTGLDRLPGVLSDHQPEVLLLMGGINDIHQGTAPLELVGHLRSMVQEGRSRGATVYLGTLLPQRAGACRNYADASDILDANAGLRSMAFLEGAIVVDLHAAFLGSEATLLGDDGLHPSLAGYVAMAETFFSAIRATLETATPN